MATHNVFPEADKEMSDFAHAVLNNNREEVVEILQRTSGLVTKQVTYQKHSTFERTKGYHALLLATGRQLETLKRLQWRIQEFPVGAKL